MMTEEEANDMFDMNAVLITEYNMPEEDNRPSAIENGEDSAGDVSEGNMEVYQMYEELMNIVQT